MQTNLESSPGAVPADRRCFRCLSSDLALVTCDGAGRTPHYSMNYLKTTFLLTSMTACSGIGFMLGGLTGMLIAFGIALTMNAFAYWNSDRMVLKMYGATEVDPPAPELHRMVGQMAQQAGLPMPSVYIIENDQPNAFATATRKMRP